MTKLNFHEIPDILNLSKRYDIPVSLLGLSPTSSDAYEKLKIEPTEENKRLMFEYRKRIGKENIKASLFKLETQNTDNRNVFLADHIKKCQWVDNNFFVELDGQVGICCWNTERFGNIKDMSYDDIMKSDKFVKFREDIKNGIVPESCLNCRGFG
jgi:MoaA/NifB/PqqE/SkfB family radical SAM enzyme